MARKVKEGAAVAYLNADHPAAVDGPGHYLVDVEDNDDHTNAGFGRKVGWEKANPEGEGEPNDPENNLGHWVYVTDSDDEE